VCFEYFEPVRVARLRLGGQAVSESTVEWRSIDCTRQLCNLNCIGPLSNDTTLLNNYRHIHRKAIDIRETEVFSIDRYILSRSAFTAWLGG